MWACALLPSSGTWVFVMIGVGALMGDQFAVRAFLVADQEPTNLWNAEHGFIGADSDPLFFHCSPPDSSDRADRVDLSFTKYADDNCKFVLGNVNDFASVFTNSSVSLERYDTIMEEWGYRQNKDKLIAILVLCGAGSRVLVNQISSKALEVPF